MNGIYHPRNRQLQSCIRYISIVEWEEGERNFLVFPNPGTGLALYKGHSYRSPGPNVYQGFDRAGHDQLLHINRIDPVKVMDSGRREIITIVFHPLGVNHFLEEPLSGLVASNNGDPSFIPLNGLFDRFAETVFRHDAPEQRIEAIEDYLLKKYKQIDIPFVGAAIPLLSDLHGMPGIEAICRSIGTSPRNLARLFARHICLSPVGFRNIYQFRYSLQKKMTDGGQVPLKDIGYESNYTHASYMIRMYRKFTGLNPTAFFNQVSVESNYVFIAL